MTLAWPANLKPRTVTFEPMFRTRSGGPTLTGVSQIVKSDAGVWRAVFREMPVANPVTILAYRAFLAQLGGRESTVLVPVTGDTRWAPFPGATVANYYTSYGDGVLFGDGSAFTSTAISIVTVAAAAAGATTITIDIRAAGSIQPGHHFSIGERLYRVKTVGANTLTYPTRTPAFPYATSLLDLSFVDNFYSVGPVATERRALTFWPPLRDAVAANATVNFATPACRMRLASDDQALDLEFGRYAFPSLEFIEAF
jgi:hypothetical protein